MARFAPCGSWQSPITAKLAASAAISFSCLQFDGADLYWLENRPQEHGRSTIMQRTSTSAGSERTPPGFNVRSTVHEYGGGAFVVFGATIFFVNFNDQRIYRQDPPGAPSAVTPEDGCRYADLTIDHHRRRLLCVREDHSMPGEAKNTIAAVPMDGHGSHVLVSGNDFYSSPRLSPDGTKLAFLTWNHPNMPWDGCELQLAEVGPDGSIGPGMRVAGGASEAIFQPEWSPGGVLHYVSDATGWWNLYQWKAGTTSALHPKPADLGRAMWSFGLSTYGFASENQILCSYTEQGIDYLAWLDTRAGELVRVDCPYTSIAYLRCGSVEAAFIGASSTSPPTLVRVDLRTGRLEPIRSAFQLELDSSYIASAVPLEWTNPEGLQVHGLYYAPTNPKFAPSAERPPLLVLSHSGPTSAASPALQYSVQYWSSRGIAVVDINYGGSTGYGREYRRRLNGQWGVIDVEDCCSGALHIAQQGLVDRPRLAIRGSSAGGFTALACLTRRADVFSVASARYAVADLEILAQHSHKFEAHVLDTLVGPYPQSRDLYRARSPIQNVRQTRCAVILFHGEDDRVVPIAHSQRMFDALRQQGLPTAFLRFGAEGHGFRKSATLERVLEAELSFMAKIYRFAPADPIEPISIENMPIAG